MCLTRLLSRNFSHPETTVWSGVCCTNPSVESSANDSRSVHMSESPIVLTTDDILRAGDAKTPGSPNTHFVASFIGPSTKPVAESLLCERGWWTGELKHPGSPITTWRRKTCGDCCSGPGRTAHPQSESRRRRISGESRKVSTSDDRPSQPAVVVVVVLRRNCGSRSPPPSLPRHEQPLLVEWAVSSSDSRRLRRLSGDGLSRMHPSSLSSRRCGNGEDLALWLPPSNRAF